MSRGAASRLREGDCRAILAFLTAAHDADPATPYPAQLIANLAELIEAAYVLCREKRRFGRYSPSEEALRSAARS